MSLARSRLIVGCSCCSLIDEPHRVGAKNVGRLALVEAVRQERPRFEEVNGEVRQL